METNSKQKWMSGRLTLEVRGVIAIIDYEQEVMEISNEVPKEQQVMIGRYLKAAGFIPPPRGYDAG